ncbi:hypothetical protein MNBD_GAMMA09-2097, partial [hydrothermal vent metagenome]
MGLSNSEPAFKLINGIKWAYLKRGNGRNLLCMASTYELFEKIEKKAKIDFHSLYVQKQIIGLSADTGGFRNLFNKFSALKRKLKLQGGEIEYEMCGGDVLLTRLTIDLNYHNVNVKGVGLYEVQKDIKDEWAPKPVKSISTTHAAVNGTVKSIEQSAKLLPDFINHGYPQAPLGNKDKYTLFHNPYNGFADADWKCIQDSTGIFGGTQAARQLAAAIEIAAKEHREVNWTVHERGCAIFKQALRLVNTAPQYDYSKQTVFYANAVVNIELIDQQRKRVGMQLSKKGFLTNKTSVHQGFIAGNWVSESAILWQMGNKGGAITKGLARITKIGGATTFSIAMPGLMGAAPWVIGLIGMLGPNLFARYSNQ